MSINIDEEKVSVQNINHPNDVHIYFGRNCITWNKEYSPALNIWRNGQLFTLDTKTFDINNLRKFLK